MPKRRTSKEACPCCWRPSRWPGQRCAACREAQCSPDDHEHSKWCYVKEACRRPECTALQRQLQAEYRAKRKARVAAGELAVPHGLNGYVNYGCKCPVCTEANSRKQAQVREAAESGESQQSDDDNARVTAEDEQEHGSQQLVARAKQP